MRYRGWALVAVVALAGAACPAAAPDGRDGGSSLEGAGPDAQCPGSIVLAPIVFHAYQGDFTCLTVVDPAMPRVSLRVWLAKDGAVVLDTTVKCAEPIVLENLPPGDYELASGLAPLLAFGAGLLLAGEEYPPGCPLVNTPSFCAPLQVTVAPCATVTTALDLYCTMVVVDGCHGF